MRASVSPIIIVAAAAAAGVSAVAAVTAVAGPRAMGVSSSEDRFTSGVRVFGPGPEFFRAVESFGMGMSGAGSGMIDDGGSYFTPSLAEPARQAFPGQAEFYFTRAVYSSGGGSRFGGGWGGRRRGGGGSWGTDYPKADRQFMAIIDRLVDLDMYPDANAVRLDDPELRRFPFLYTLEVGRMRMTRAEAEGLRTYLEAGGFLVVDDFWGEREWANFAFEMSKVLPDRPIVELSLDHPIFHMVYDITDILQVPNINRAQGGPTWETFDSQIPHVRGIFDDEGRLMVVINFNTDLGDAWEWAEQPQYPLKYSRFACEMGINMIVYAMSH